LSQNPIKFVFAIVELAFYLYLCAQETNAILHNISIKHQFFMIAATAALAIAGRQDGKPIAPLT
jgi:hypothetical protein